MSKGKAEGREGAGRTLEEWSLHLGVSGLGWGSQGGLRQLQIRMCLNVHSEGSLTEQAFLDGLAHGSIQ